MASFFSSPDTPDAISRPKDTAGTKAQAADLKRREAGGLTKQTDLAGFRQMMSSYQDLKPTLGA